MSWDGKVDLAADAVVFHIDPENSNNVSVLLIERKGPPFKGKWALPGGGVDLFEKVEDACERELEEETTLLLPFEVNRWTALTVRAHPLRDPRGRVVGFPFAIVLTGPRPPVRAQDDAKNVRWWPLAALEGGDLAFDHVEIVAEAAHLFGFEPFSS